MGVAIFDEVLMMSLLTDRPRWEHRAKTSTTREPEGQPDLKSG
jgi:hypothetical protein